jgi:large subunit ribosomal protein L22
MQFSAKAKFVRYSPYKLRPLADVIRGKNAEYALHVLQTFKSRRSVPLYKVLASAIANAKDRNDLAAGMLVIKDLRVDEGPIFRYFKPGAMGRANIQRKRMSHLSVTLEHMNDKEV